MYIPVYGSIIIFKFCRQFQYLALKWDSIIIFFNVFLWDDFIDFVSVHTETANPRAMVEMGQLGKKELYFN